MFRLNDHRCRRLKRGCSVPLGIEVKRDDLTYSIRGIRFTEGKNKAFQFQSLIDGKKTDKDIVQAIVQVLAPSDKRESKRLLYGREPSKFVRDFLESNGVEVDFVRTLSAEGIVAASPVNVEGKSIIITSRYALGPAMDQMMGNPNRLYVLMARLN